MDYNRNEMFIKDGNFAVLRLNKRNEVLFSEYIRAKDAGISKAGLINAIEKVLRKNKELPVQKQATKILERLLVLRSHRVVKIYM